MKKIPLFLQVIGFSSALLCAAHSLQAQSPTPPPCPSETPSPTCPPAPPFPPCPLGVGWAEGLARYTKYPAPPFPTGETQSLCAVDCNFHQWSWEAFVWATAIGADGRARFTTLPNGDELGKKAAPTKGPKPLGLKPRDLKPMGARQNRSGDDPAQAGGGLLVDQNGQILWYSTHMNPAYFQFVQKNGGAGYGKAPATLNFPVGAVVFKASWRVAPDGTSQTGFYTEKTTVPVLVNNPCGGIMVDPLGKTRAVTVALVGLHVVGVTANHPEFLWATFEQVKNAPDLPAGTAYNSTSPVSNQSFTFYAANTPANACNQKASALKVTDPVKQTVAPVTNVFRQFATGGATPAGRVTDIENINKASQNEMANMIKQKPPQPRETVWANYKLIGTLWLGQPGGLKPGISQLEICGVGSVDLANSTLETFFQGPQNNFNGNSVANCFMCHNTGGSNSGPKQYPGKNINLSHALLESIPGPTPTPKPTCSPTPGG
ncbi:MAG: hypothetical protein QOC70_2651 [Verrucomicrobiota bacterium]|jgi:hypothetical protein